VTIELSIVAVFAVILTAAMTGAVRRLALARGVIDVPNSRSSHSTATTRGGGIAIVIVFTVASIGIAWKATIRLDTLVALLGGSVPVAIVGFYDDRSGLSPRLRLTVHLAAALWALIWLGGMPPVRVGEHLLELGWLGNLVALLGIVWTLNLFNFMDGIDGIAASEALFISCAASGLVVLAGGDHGVAAMGLIFSAACAGFLVWNWPPAKIFMGDVGSGYLGYVIAILALSATRANPAAVWVWLILGGAFFVDATVTLIRRAMLGEALHVAHRSHAYQWLSRKWGSHLLVTSSFAMVNLLWLFPWALLASLYPRLAALIVMPALIPLGFLAVRCRAGQPEKSQPIHPPTGTRPSA